MQIIAIRIKSDVETTKLLPEGFIPRGLSLWQRNVVLWIEVPMDGFVTSHKEGVQVRIRMVKPGYVYPDMDDPAIQWQFAGALTVNDNEIALLCYLGVECDSSKVE